MGRGADQRSRVPGVDTRVLGRLAYVQAEPEDVGASVAGALRHTGLYDAPAHLSSGAMGAGGLAVATASSRARTRWRIGISITEVVNRAFRAYFERGKNDY
jgi:hypothetical protein